MNTQLTEKPHINELKKAGDFCFAEGAKRQVIMTCPVCAVVFVCSHEIAQDAPLTLSPSVVGPKEGFAIPVGISPREQVLTPCGHHFWVKDGQAIDAM